MQDGLLLDRDAVGTLLTGCGQYPRVGLLIAGTDGEDAGPSGAAG